VPQENAVAQQQDPGEAPEKASIEDLKTFTLQVMVSYNQQRVGMNLPFAPMNRRRLGHSASQNHVNLCIEASGSTVPRFGSTLLQKESGQRREQGWSDFCFHRSN
jgi:hypothetical protein